MKWHKTTSEEKQVYKMETREREADRRNHNRSRAEAGPQGVLILVMHLVFFIPVCSAGLSSM